MHLPTVSLLHNRIYTPFLTLRLFLFPALSVALALTLVLICALSIALSVYCLLFTSLLTHNVYLKSHVLYFPANASCLPPIACSLPPCLLFSVFLAHTRTHINQLHAGMKTAIHFG